MIQETIATGRDVNAAIDNGCRELGINREEDIFDFEIIAREKKGFLGLKTYPAKVRVFRELPDPKPVREEKPKPAPAPAPQREPKPRPQREERPAAPELPKEPPKETREEPKEPHRESRLPREKKPREPRPPREQYPAPEKALRENQESRPPRVEVEPNDNVRVRVERSAAYVERILRIMGIENVKVTPKYYEDNVCLQLTGTGLGVIIGRRGETLDSIQYLSSLVANRGEGDYIRINIDSGNYREKRERTLEALARNLAGFAGSAAAVMDARCGQVYAGLFSLEEGEVRRLAEDTALSILELGKLLPGLKKPVFLVGDGAELCYNKLLEEPPPGPPPEEWLRLAPQAGRRRRGRRPCRLAPGGGDGRRGAGACLSAPAPGGAGAFKASGEVKPCQSWSKT